MYLSFKTLRNSKRKSFEATTVSYGHSQSRALHQRRKLSLQATSTMPSFYDSTVEKYAMQPMTRLSLNYMLDFGKNAYGNDRKILQSARFVQRELPIRLAHRLMDLMYLPWIIATNPNIHLVYQTYFTSFNLIRSLPTVTTMEDNQQLNDLLKELVELNAPMIDALAKGLRECRQKLGPHMKSQLQLDDFLDSMLRSRISRRLMAEQHLGIQTKKDGWVGTVQLNLPLWNVCSASARNAEYVCLETYGMAPDLKIKGNRDLTLTYIPGHLEYVLYELFKNAFRATVEHHLKNRFTSELPEILVTLCEMSNGVTIRISDKGGGIDPSQLDDVFRYGFTTADDMLPIPNDDPSGFMALQRNDTRLMAGLGFGLPMGRLFARFFGGDLKLVSIPGYGTDIYLSIKSLHHAEQETAGLNVM